MNDELLRQKEQESKGEHVGPDLGTVEISSDKDWVGSRVFNWLEIKEMKMNEQNHKKLEEMVIWDENQERMIIWSPGGKYSRRAWETLANVTTRLGQLRWEMRIKPFFFLSNWKQFSNMRTFWRSGGNSWSMWILKRQEKTN